MSRHRNTKNDYGQNRGGNKMNTLRICISVAMLGLASATAQAEEAASPLVEGSYLTLMGTGILPQDKSGTSLKDGYGGTVGFGIRKDFYAMEVFGQIADLDGATVRGFGVNGLLFPFSSWRHVYGTVGLSGLEYADYKTPAGSWDDSVDFNTINADAGVGALWPLDWGRYDYAIRTEVRYRFGRRERDYNDLDRDFDAPRDFEHIVINIGLQLPTRKRAPVVAAAPVEPVVVTPPPVACSDGVDNDGDGKIDFPNDPGCSAADDSDETDEAPPCKAPMPGEQISLNGCATGDVLVLRGVNFEFDQARLTANAKTILDGVADALLAAPAVRFEIGGHTDAKGSDDYNQRLSERRAKSVVQYLGGKGIAADRMTAAGYGESRPIADNDSDEGREANRRVELKISQSGVGEPASAAAPAAPAESGVAAQPSAAAEPATAEPAAESAPAAEALPLEPLP